MQHFNDSEKPGIGIDRADGFTLIDVIIAMAILGVAMLAISTLISGSAITNRKSGDMTTALVWATDQIERFNTMPFNDPLLADADGNGQAGWNDGYDDNPANIDPTLSDSFNNGGPILRENGKYQIFYNVADTDFSSKPGIEYKTIRIFVTAMASGSGLQCLRVDHIKSNI